MAVAAVAEAITVAQAVLQEAEAAAVQAVDRDRERSRLAEAANELAEVESAQIRPPHLVKPRHLEAGTHQIRRHRETQ